MDLEVKRIIVMQKAHVLVNQPSVGAELINTGVQAASERATEEATEGATEASERPSE